jgi:Mrp family chromosome partitioning ATPase/uncharacterized protein involved in exopolysaccharide biosynthesis
MPVTAVTTVEDASPSTRDATHARTRRRWLVACCLIGGLLGGGLAFGLTPLLPTTYTAQSQLVLGGPGNRAVFGGIGSGNTSIAPSSAAQLLRSQNIADEASSALDGRLTPGEVSRQVSVTSDANSPVITIAASAATAELARDLADAIPAAYLALEANGYAARAEQTAQVLEELRNGQTQRLDDVQAQLAVKTAAASAAAPTFFNQADRATYVRATLETDVEYQRLRNEAASLTNSINDTTDAIDQSNVNYLILQSGVDRVIGAQLPAVSNSPVSRRNLLVGMAMGALLGAALAWWVTERRRVVDPTAAAGVLGAPLLGTFGPARELRRFPRLVDLSSDHATGNELKVLASSVLLSAHRRSIASVVITSARAREGKTVLAYNIAAAAEYTGNSVTLVDAASGSTITHALDLQGSPGLAEILDGGPPADSLHLFSYDDDRTLPVVPVGLNGWRQEPGRRLNEERRAAWSAAFRHDGAPTAIVDAPALNAHALPLQLAQGGAVVVVVSPRTTLTDLEVLRTRAEIADVPVLGFIRNEYRARRRSGHEGPSRHGSDRGRPVLRTDPERPAEATAASPPAFPVFGPPAPRRPEEDVETHPRVASLPTGTSSPGEDVAAEATPSG